MGDRERRESARADLFDQFQDEEEPPPSLAKSLERGGIVERLPGTSRDKVLQAMVHALPLPAQLDRDLLLRLFLAREVAASTGIGSGIAIPHVRNPIILQVPEPLVTLCFLEQPIDFGALDCQPVHTLFAVISPTTRGHLQLLARIAFALHDVEFKTAITSHARADVILKEAGRIDAGLASAATAGKAAH